MLAAGLCLGRAAPAAAIGGLTPLRSEAIRLYRRELLGSCEQVRVHYVFTKTSHSGIETLVAFPLPDVERSPVARAGLRAGAGLPYHRRRATGAAATGPAGVSGG
jgi:hypothetical protein